MRNLIITLLIAGAPFCLSAQESERPRARDLGMTIIEGDSIRTGVTAILPHGGNLYSNRVPAAIHVGNGFGKLLGVTQIQELGEIETPILLTCTLCVWRAADAMVGWMLAQEGMENVRSINPVVGETNDGRLNDIRSRPIEANHVIAALESATNGPVMEGAIGAGAGTVAFGWMLLSRPSEHQPAALPSLTCAAICAM